MRSRPFDVNDYSRWKLAGKTAAFIIALSIPLSLIVHSPAAVPAEKKAEFVGGGACIDCHRQEYNSWKGSHHDHAMDVASDSTVLGDFNNSAFERFGFTSKFYKKEGKFFVYTKGPDGVPGEFQITNTFGYTPLQQYLIPFENGRYQCLPIAWDTIKKEWFYLSPPEYKNKKVNPNDWLYWTNNGQNWNGMCAECHSTNLRKNFNLETKTFSTAFSDIDVNCEACHGPGSLHIDWAKLPEMSRTYDDNLGLVVKTSGIDNKQFVDNCAYCHSRRSSLSPMNYDRKDILDLIIPATLDDNYFPDGQIKNEDYVYGSFLQSRMYDKGVQCNDCHDSHSLKLKYAGNKLCAQCHQPDIYDSPTHHFHKSKGEEGSPLKLKDKIVEVGEGALCVNCHMPGEYFMERDFRRDHSFRIPRPDLTISIGAPNACNQCHSDKTAEWSESYILKWYGKSRRYHYGNAFAGGRKMEETAKRDLAHIAQDDLYPAIVRGTAISLLSAYDDSASIKTVKNSMNSGDSFIRYQAVHSLNLANDDDINKTLQSLNDPVKAVRIDAAVKLSALPKDRIPDAEKHVLEKAVKEYRQTQEYAADFAAGRFNLGILNQNLGNMPEAIKQYNEAVKIDSLFYPAKVNLAMAYYHSGELNKAEKTLLDLDVHHPEFTGANYYLGLLYAEQKKYASAARRLEKAAKLTENNRRIYYNLGLIYQYLNDFGSAEKNLLLAYKKDTGNADYIYALTAFYNKRGRGKEALKYAYELKKAAPNNKDVENLIDYLLKK